MIDQKPAVAVERAKSTVKRKSRTIRRTSLSNIKIFNQLEAWRGV